MTGKPRRPWLAALLTLLTRGLGHLYVGNPRRGLILCGIEQLCTVALVAIIIIVPNKLSLLFAVFGGIAYIAYCIFDAVSIAKKNKDNYELKKYNRWFVYIGYVIIMSVLVSTLVSAGIKANLVESFKIPSGAMIPTLLIGDRLLANKFIYKTTEPKRRDIIIFPYPDDPSRTFVKRLIAVEGDVVEIRNKKLFVNGKEQEEPYIINTDSGISKETRDNFGPITVPPGKLFFMGDNRDQSYDSRFYGYVSKDTITGKAIILYWSWNKETSTVRWDRIGKLVK